MGCFVEAAGGIRGLGWVFEAASGKDPRATHCVMCVGDFWLWLAVYLGRVSIMRPEAVCCVPVWLVCDVSRSGYERLS